ncbi:hypothetical protein [Geomicrobium sp. JCM 19038]|uniref:hypothetical protein n=1 Tax=Geomicrobium sp. JCM 19038 TaxID=1460635 RepID=UPI00045F34E8|nr:hypothetical protein [Geomicrobium sp. JCM 19038]GAK07776.1 hypothetical protein JCM19038_1520 [Geomicrobium sp. JCM 19038]
MGADNQTMICERRTYRKEPYTHRHAYAQILFPLQGSMEIETVNGKQTLKDKALYYSLRIWNIRFTARAITNF